MSKATRLLLLAAIIFFHFRGSVFACGYNYFSSCATQMEITANGTSTTFFVGNCTYLTDFQNNNFGSVNELSLHKLTQFSWESCTNKVMNAKFYFRVYQTGTTPGTFSILNIPQTVLGGAGDYRNRTFESIPDFDLLAGLVSGNTYTMEVYFLSDVDFNLDNIPDGNLTRNNGGLNFKATFKKGGTVGGLSVTFPTKTNVSCAGGNNGSVTALATGGTTPYTYTWSNSVLGAINQNLVAGTYTVTVTGANGVSGTGVTSITQPQQLNANLTEMDETSATANNGSVTVAPTGGTSPYTYQWSTGGLANTIINLDAGTYSVTIRDSKGCQIVQTATVNTSGAVPGGYCATTSSFPWNEWVGQVTLEALNNTSDKSVYSNFTNLAPPTLIAGQAYPMTLKTGTGWFGNAETWRAWIDYNRNGVFDASEIVLDAQSNPPVSGLTQLVVNQSIVLPTTALAGITRMRVMIKRGGTPLPCETLAFGEAEDYNVNIVATTGGGTCTLAASANSVICNDNATPTNPADDTYSFVLNVSGTGTGTGWTSTINGAAVTGTYGAVKNLGPYNISAGAITFTITDNTDATCKKVLTVTPPATCSGGGGPLAYCTSKSNFPWEEWISRVTFGGINNPSGKWYYTDYSAQTGSVARGQSYPIIINSSYSWNINAPHFRVWIDYNRDGVFTEPGEIAYSGMLTGVANGTQDAPLNGTVSVPSTATLGVTKMRVSLRRDGYPTPCEALIPYGEVEDYNINITATLASAGNRSNLMEIVAKENLLHNELQTFINVLQPVRQLRLERAGEDYEWATLEAWKDIYLPELENISIKSKDITPLDGLNHYRFVAILESGEILVSNVESVLHTKPLDFSIFPNPVADAQVYVNLEKLIGKEVVLTVLHSTGKILFSEKIDNVTESATSLNIGNLLSGEYYLNLRSAGIRPVTKKFVVVREN